MDKTLTEILTADSAVAPKAGPFGPGDAVLEQTLRDFIELQSNTIAVGTNLVGVRSVNWTEFKWYTGAEGSFSYPLDDSAVADPTKIGTSSYTAQLSKGQGRTVFLDSTLLRGDTWENMDRQQMAIVRNRADVIDTTILSALVAGAGQSVAVAAGAEWDTDNEDAEGVILDAMDKIFENGRVSGDEPMALVVPAKLRSCLMNTSLYGNVVQSLADHLKSVANMTIYYSRDSNLADTALLLIPGSETAEFFTYNGPGFQETELTRIPGVGYDWLLTSYMGTVVHEHQDGAASGKNNRICKITNVVA